MAFADRTDAGTKLAVALEAYSHTPDTVVFALPRGGVPVAAPVAQSLGLPLDVMIVGKLGVPGQPELAFGAISSDGAVVFNSDIVDVLRLTKPEIDKVRASKQKLLTEREQRYRAGTEALEISGQTVIIVDDGLATGATMKAAVLLARKRQAKKIIVAVPVGSVEACSDMENLADELVCLHRPSPFRGVSSGYRDFRQTADAEVLALLHGDRHNPSCP